MPNTVQLTKNGQPVFPVTDVSLVMGLAERPLMDAVYAWDGTGTPDITKIPAGVSVEYNTTTYTGTLAASADTTGRFYLVPSTTVQGEYDRYLTDAVSGSYAWKPAGTTAIPTPSIVDNLESTDPTKALSAKQGNVLSQEVSQLEAEVGELEDGNISPNYTLTQGSVKTDGTLGTSVNYSRTSPIPLKQGQTIVVSSQGYSFSPISQYAEPLVPLVVVTNNPGDGVTVDYSYTTTADISVVCCARTANPYRIYIYGLAKDLAKQVDDLVISEDLIVTGKMDWTDNSIWHNGGYIQALTGWARTTNKIKGEFYQLLLNIENDVTTSSYVQINYWLNGVYAGYRNKNGYFLPGGTATSSITFDYFAISVRKSDFPDYETRYVINGLNVIGKDGYMGIADVGTTPSGENGSYYIANKEGQYSGFGGISLNRGEVAILVKKAGTWVKQSVTGDYTGYTPPVIANGNLPWVVGSYYNYTDCSIVTNSSYARTLFLPSEFYPLISNFDNDISTSGSSYYVVSYYLKGVYVGYRLINGYHLPNGTTVSSITFDSFAIAVNKGNVTTYATRYKMRSLSDLGAKTNIGRSFYALGDSTTAGIGSSENPVVSWSDILAGLLSFNSYTKKAVSGATCLYHEGYGRLSSQISSLSSIGGAIVTVMIGVNDFFRGSTLGSVSDAMAASYSQLDDTTDFARAFRYCIETLRRNFPDSVVIVMLPLPTYDSGNAHGKLDETDLFAIRDIEREICGYLGVPVVETQKEFGLSRYTNDWSHFFDDYAHPNDTGYNRIAHCMLGKVLEYGQ